MVNSIIIVLTYCFLPACSSLLLGSAPSSTELKTFSINNGLKEEASLSLSKGVLPLAWSPTDYYLAVGSYTPLSGAELDIYQFNNQTMSLIHVASDSIGAPVYILDWHPTLNYIVVGVTGASGDEVRLYSFSPSSKTVTLQDTIKLNHGVLAAVRWDPLGNYLALATRGNQAELFIYSLNIASKELSFVNSLNLINCQNLFFDTIRFSPLGDYIAIGGSKNTSILALNRVTGILEQAILENNGYNRTIDWSPFNNWISVGIPSSSDNLKLYVFNEVNQDVSLLPDYFPTGSKVVFRTEWHPSGRYLFSGPMNGNGNEFKLYGLVNSKDEMNPQLEEVQKVLINWSVYAARWSKDGLFFAVTTSSRFIKIYSLDLVETDSVETSLLEDLINVVI